MDPEPATHQPPLPTEASAKEGVSHTSPRPALPADRLPLFLGFLSLLLLLSSLFLAYQNMQLKKQITALQTSPISQITPTTSVDPTTNWKTYKNTKYGFEFKYPKNYFLLDKEPTIYISSQDFNVPEYGWGNSQITDINIKIESESIDTMMNRWDRVNLLKQKLELPLLGYRLDGNFETPDGLKNITQVYIQIPNNNKNISFSYIPDIIPKDIFDQILSTFKFMSQETIPSIMPQELSAEWYWGTETQKKQNTPVNWIYTDMGRNSCWHSPEVTCTPSSVKTEPVYTCPPSGWVDCMPIIDGAKKKACSQEAMAWYETNCPNFRGGAL